MNKKKVSVILLLAMFAVSMFAAISVNAVPVPPVPPNADIFEWTKSPDNGTAVHESLMLNPEWLKVRTGTHVDHDTRIHVLGKDTYGQDVEAIAEIPESTSPEQYFPLIDPHSGEPVVFQKVTGILQQGGTHCNSFIIYTHVDEVVPRIPRQVLLGMYHHKSIYDPIIGIDGFPVEPPNPEPIKVALDWIDADGDGQPDKDECIAQTIDHEITVIGLDQYGNMLEETFVIPAGEAIWPLDVVSHSWSTVCDVSGGLYDVSYYIWTHPQPQRSMFVYKIRLDHIEVTADPKNILADGKATSTITITLYDIDDHEVHWAVYYSYPDVLSRPIEINVAATGGKVAPSLGIEIPGCNTYAETTLTADTNPRIIRVSALAVVPELSQHPSMKLMDDDIVCFDGINSVPHRPTLEIIDIGGEGSGRHYAVFRMLSEGCNLISIPVIPDEALTWDMLPCSSMSLLSVATYQGGAWLYYDYQAGTGDIIPIVDGWAYWVKAEKPCTLVISGRIMDQYDKKTGFGLPPMYLMAMGWNMVGVTSIRMPIATADYLESLHNLGLGEKLWGPLWVYRGSWIRNPATLYPTEGMWLFTYDGILAP